MEIKQTPVSKCLDKKMVIMGFEIPDLLVIFLTLSILNFLFGMTSLKVVAVWLPTIALAIVLRLSKRGKPDNYLIHWIRFQIRPGVISAFQDPTEWNFPPKARRQKR
jgi:hypothetical protein